MALPRLVLVGEQADAQDRPQDLVFEGLVVLQASRVQDVVDVLGFGESNESSCPSTESKDIDALHPADHPIFVVQADGQCFVRGDEGAGSA